MHRICNECGDKFNPNSKEKKKVGGLITNCPECSEEVAIKVLGFASGDGKMSAISIVAPKTQSDANALKKYWNRASGMNKGKSCQLNTPGLTMPKLNFRTISTAQNMNHKGKM